MFTGSSIILAVPAFYNCFVVLNIRPKSPADDAFSEKEKGKWQVFLGGKVSRNDHFTF